ncbi:cadherin-like domain-containing protein [Methylobacterium oryzisoli]|uniref:cadherin-like domain-containing protein n=1 Tax=Methylobacterium oryzisoli TaxID=3385502 RepID=UPI003891B68E
MSDSRSGAEQAGGDAAVAPPLPRVTSVNSLLSGFTDIRTNRQDIIDANLQAVRDIMAASSPADRSAARADDTTYNTAGIAGPALGGLAARGLPYGNADGFGWTINDAAGNQATVAKNFFNNPRPFLVDRSIRPAVAGSGGSLPSGHTTKGFAESLWLAYIFPERYQQILTRASEYGEHRIVNGVHYPLDVIAGRMVGEWAVATYLDPTVNVSNSARFNNSAASVRGAMVTALASSGQTIAQQAASGPTDRFSDGAVNQANWTRRLTYGLPSVAPSGQPMSVPTEAGYLLATRFPYLNLAQIDEILRTTTLPSGVVMDNGNGWARLDLYRAADGYAALAADTTVTMDAAAAQDDRRPGAGFNAADTWRNDIGGPGTLTKAGSGVLTLAGSNSFAGFDLQAGGLTLTGASNLSGSSKVEGGVLAATGATLATAGDLQIDQGATLQLGKTRLAVAGTLAVAGDVTLLDAGELAVAQAATISGTVSGQGGLVKSGTGALTLSGTETYTGATAVQAGTLLVDGSLAAASAVTVAAGARLGGSGTVAGSLTSACLLSAGDADAGTGTLTTGALTLQASATLHEDIDATGRADTLAVQGAVTLAPGARLDVARAAGQAQGRRITVLTATGDLTGDFTDAGGTTDLADGATFTDDGHQYRIAYQRAATGSSVTLIDLTLPPLEVRIDHLSGDSVTFTEKGPPVALDAGLDATVSDDNAPNFGGGTLTAQITANGIPSEDVLGFGGGVALSNGTQVGSGVSVDGVVVGTIAKTGSGGDPLVVSLDADATPARVQTLVRSLVYRNTNAADPGTAPRSVAVTVGDGVGGTSTAATVTVTVAAVDDAPTATMPGGPVNAPEQVPTPVDAGLTLTDPDSKTLATATMAISGHYVPGQDRLAFAPDTALYGDIHGSFDAGTGVLQLSSAGGSTLAQWQAALRSVSYVNGSDAPDTAARTISLTLNDGSLASVPVTTQVTPVPVNDAPTGTDTTITLRADASVTITANDFGFTDPKDAPADGLKAVVIDTLPNSGNLTLDGAAVSAGQSIAAADLAAGKLLFLPQVGGTGAGQASLTFQVRDDGGTASGGIDLDPTPRTLSFTILPVNHAPLAQDDTAATRQDRPLILASATLLANDTDPDGDVLRITGVERAEHGSVALDAGTGLVTFTPDQGYVGPAAFSYTAADGQGGTAAARVAVTVDPAPSGGGWGDVHYATFDGLRYDLQATGDFLITRALGGAALEIEGRAEGTGGVSFLTAVSIRSGEHDILFDEARPDAIEVDGRLLKLAIGARAEFDDLVVNRSADDAYRLVTGAGDGIGLLGRGTYMDIDVAPGAGRADGSFEGLLGNLDGDTSNDLALRDGTRLHEHAQALIEGVYADAWRAPGPGALIAELGAGSLAERTAWYADHPDANALGAPTAHPGALGMTPT